MDGRTGRSASSIKRPNSTFPTEAIRPKRQPNPQGAHTQACLPFISEPDERFPRASMPRLSTGYTYISGSILLYLHRCPPAVQPSTCGRPAYSMPCVKDGGLGNEILLSYIWSESHRGASSAGRGQSIILLSCVARVVSRRSRLGSEEQRPSLETPREPRGAAQACATRKARTPAWDRGRCGGSLAGESPARGVKAMTTTPTSDSSDAHMCAARPAPTLDVASFPIPSRLSFFWSRSID